ncbi:DUF4382 domain-containing protein [Teredinibacter sp. KSP-S5-2]|uniref:DUF4382 domain-containing protein n=1 Tax=Teredinibacter sp. KSP-S5-2 TaxID=3034506 RepID=UPI00293482D7|nr:DUF4382 domain-containing protein [Teredinibacter sp. KSP-S5-2]WNO11437.1 DUF4382 domain-containing protein [Teredinibacter sp. KSP-S5-2]
MKTLFSYPIFFSLFLCSCGGGGGYNSNSSSVDKNDSNQSTPTLSINLTDAPVDNASNVYVSIRGLALNFEDSGWVDYDLNEVERVDLLTLQSGTTLSLLSGLEVVPGEYRVRLNLYDDGDETTFEHSIVIEEGGLEYNLFIPSGDQTGLKLNSNIIVPESGSIFYTIDFSVRKSIVRRGKDHNYLLKPVLTLIENSRAGSISGVIEDTTLLDTDCSDDDPISHNAIYVYAGHDVIPDDIGSAGAQPVATVLVEYDEVSGEFSYNIPFIEVGDYTVSLTCNADLENIETDDELLFKATVNETVSVVEANNNLEE